MWKVLGLAGLAGVAATAGVVAARKRRSWPELDPDELRAKLHERLEQHDEASSSVDGPSQTEAQA